MAYLTILPLMLFAVCRQIFVAVKARQRVLAQRVVKACQHIKQQAAWDAWLQVIGEPAGVRLYLV